MKPSTTNSSSRTSRAQQILKEENRVAVAKSISVEPTLARHGYRLKDMTEQFDAKAAEIRAMFSNQLEPKRTAEIRERMLAAGLPI
jgi:hypothetical protein